jgi:histone deacetylase 1/2
MHALTKDHWSIVKRILCYLQAIITYGLHITRDSLLSLHGFTDADWADSINNHKSTSGYLVYLSSTSISWKSRKQRTVVRSSTEAKYKALADGTAEILWIHSLLSELRVPSSIVTMLWCDNLGVTFLSANPVFHARTKHVEIDYHFVRDRVTKREIQVRFISSKDQLVDVLTKPFPPVSFAYFRSKLLVESPPLA